MPVSLLQDTSLLAVKMARTNLEGIDVDGGLIYEYFPESMEVDNHKHWWPQAEAMVGYFNAWQHSGEQVFLEKALGSWEFIKAYLVDRDYGEWYWSVNGDRVPQTDKEKAGFWKCPYHNSRACLELIRRIDEIVVKLTK